MKFNTPILLLTFNRPKYVLQMIDLLRSVAPTQLFISCDGPRNTKDQIKIDQIKEIINTNVDWKCQIHTNFSSTNLGCKWGVKNGIDWFFAAVESGIILEDDCQPNNAFFFFCQDLLYKYNNNKKVMSISGSNFLSKPVGNDSYFFTKHPICWGWATWRRAWKEYDIEMKKWPKQKESGWLVSILHDADVTKYWTSLFDKVFKNKIDTWDYQWVYSIWKQNGICISPQVNLVTNIGYGSQATHTKFADYRTAGLKTHQLIFPLDHPDKIAVSLETDSQIQQNMNQENVFKNLTYLLLGTFTHEINSLKRKVLKMIAN